MKSDDAYYNCKDVKERKEVRARITDSRDAYYYCRNIKDTKEIRDRITDSYYAYRYCRYVKELATQDVLKYLEVL